MSIFGMIKDAIWGKKAQAAPAPAAVAPAAVAPATPAAIAPAAPPAAAPMTPAEIETLLAAMAAEHGEALNWRDSIVDLMKLVGLDPTLANRKELAEELGYPGERDGSAAMNIWLHKQVMEQLAGNRGAVPAALTH
ncbi:DUF3597 domain-containing protein [Sphingomonas sp.]|uniref:DUF3597 domain-containing protein n=1 Tax=Sphingomonas sp. TaxID=28214 RepID=UPI001D83F5CB|nr:DUF3597 domain-containing protein [Sphingomonas sp.]MBX9796073.1 DUF3597 domain-containing protein [Sphingomonas sp.]